MSQNITFSQEAKQKDADCPVLVRTFFCFIFKYATMNVFPIRLSEFLRFIWILALSLKIYKYFYFQRIS